VTVTVGVPAQPLTCLARALFQSAVAREGLNNIYCSNVSYQTEKNLSCDSGQAADKPPQVFCWWQGGAYSVRIAPMKFIAAVMSAIVISPTFARADEAPP